MSQGQCFTDKRTKSTNTHTWLQLCNMLSHLTPQTHVSAVRLTYGFFQPAVFLIQNPNEWTGIVPLIINWAGEIVSFPLGGLLPHASQHFYFPPEFYKIKLTWSDRTAICHVVHIKFIFKKSIFYTGKQNGNLKHWNLCLSNTRRINQTWQEAGRHKRDEKVTVTFRKWSQKLWLTKCAVNILAKRSRFKAAL